MGYMYFLVIWFMDMSNVPSFFEIKQGLGLAIQGTHTLYDILFLQQLYHLAWQLVRLLETRFVF
jgi:hypothetical protein